MNQSTEKEPKSFNEEFKELYQLEKEMVEVGEIFTIYYNTFTPELIKKIKINRDDLEDIFPSNFQIIKELHISIKNYLDDLKQSYNEFFQSDMSNKETLATIIDTIVSIYSEKLETIISSYTSVFHRLCVALYASEHSFPKLPKKIKVEKSWTLPKVYLKYIDYVNKLFKIIVGIGEYLSGNDPNWDKNFDLTFTLQLIDTALKSTYSNYSNIVKIMNLRKYFKCREYFPTDRMLMDETQIILKVHKIDLLSDDENEVQWIEHNNEEINKEVYCFVFEDTILFISNEHLMHPLNYWLNDSIIEITGERECKVTFETAIKREYTTIIFPTETKQNEWFKLVSSKQEYCLHKKLFGKSIQQYMEQNSSDELAMIPEPIEQCLMMLMQEGIEEPFIFKKGGDNEKINGIISLMNLNKDFELPNALITSDIVKLYLRSLPEPLLTYDLIPELIVAATQGNTDQLIQLIDKLPLYNKALLNKLMKLCNMIVANKAKTRMESITLAKILAPNLCWSRNEGITGNIYILVEMLINEYSTIFGIIDTNFEERENVRKKMNEEEQHQFFEMKEQLRRSIVDEESENPSEMK